MGLYIFLLFVDLLSFFIVIVPVAWVLFLLLVHLSFVLASSLFLLFTLVVNQFFVSLLLVFNVDVSFIFALSLSGLVFHIFLLLFLVDLSHLLLSFLLFALSFAFSFFLFFFGIHLSFEIIFHFNVVVLLIPCIIVLLFLLIFVAHDLLFELYLVSYILGCLVNLSLANSHTLSDVLTSTLLLFFNLIFDTQSILLDIEGYVGHNISKFHETDGFRGQKRIFLDHLPFLLFLLDDNLNFLKL